MGQPDTNVGALCRELGVTRQTLYRHVAPDETLRDDGRRLLEEKR
jgi:transposase-like protein